MSDREYLVEDVLTIVGTAHVKATSKAEAIRKARNGEVEFVYDDGRTFRRGDGLHAHVVRPTEGGE